ncbi:MULTISPECIES: hypothetical protein [Synechococcales]|nr:hypothetical protein [Synechococcus sp. CS-1326]MCT0212548.1 hypothetical protein [Synechococcus sp. CS-1326]MCT0232064.1 hypothetical protein [Synechococcus sp. CS-1327]
MNGLILYTTEDGTSRIQRCAKGQTGWLPQREMAELFAVSSDNVGLHLKNIYAEAELTRETTTEDSSVVQPEGAREVQRPLILYNLDAMPPARPGVYSGEANPFGCHLPAQLQQQLFPLSEEVEA